MHRSLVSALSVLMVTAGATAAAPPADPDPATLVATDESTYLAFGRVFPDPQGCLPDGPGISPRRKGEVCAAGFLTWDDARAGLNFLEARFGRYLEIVNLAEDAAGWPELQGLDLRSAGLVRSDLSRERFDLYAIHLTDAESPVPLEERRHFAMMLALHGDERSGVEGGLRAIEDLVTWAACEQDPAVAPACATEGPFPKAILEPTDSGPTAGEVLREAVIVFLFGNPDGWVRGDRSRGGTIPNRANGNGVDLNRDWPVPGYVEPVHTPWSEPESVGFGRYLEVLRDRTSAGRFEGVVDFHGMLTSHALSFTLLPVDQLDYGTSQRLVSVAELTFADAEERLTWSPHVARYGQCPGPVPEPVFGRSFAPMCTDQWGTVWDTVGYNVSGAVASWAASGLGLEATGLANEMSTMAQWMLPGQSADAFQLQVDATKGLLYTELAGLLSEGPRAVLPTTGRIGYLADPTRTAHPGAAEPVRPYGPQEHVVIPDVTGTGVAGFEVLGPADGISNGGMVVDIRYANAHGTTFQSQVTPVVQRCVQNSCEDVAVYVPFSDQGHAGVALALNDPAPGRYRVIHRWHPTIRDGDTAPVALPATYYVTFTADKAYPEPQQLPYDVSRLDFFADLAPHVEGRPLEAVPFDRIARGRGFLTRYDVLVIADASWPVGVSDALRASAIRRLRSWVADGGTLVLTDAALLLLADLVVGLAGEDVISGYFNTGWMDFDDGAGATYDRHPLATGIHQPGAAEGRVVVPEGVFDNAKEIYTGPPLGFYVSPNRNANRVCDSDRCDAPIWIVRQSAWEAAGGTTAARSFVRIAPEPAQDGTPAAAAVGVSLGELRMGEGVVRIAGALLPEPTAAHHHPYGLSGYAVTPTGYRVFENLIR